MADLDKIRLSQNNERQKTLEDEELERNLKNSGIKKEYRINNGIIQFVTHEKYYKPYLLKIQCDKQAFYVLADLFGQCDREMILLWNNTEIRFETYSRH